MPSGDQLGRPSNPPLAAVRFMAPKPSARTVQTSDADSYAILVPAGDHEQRESVTSLNVICLCALPSACMVKIS